MKPLGRIAYEAYVRKAGGKSLVSGAKLPGWENLERPIKLAWDEAARAVASVSYRRKLRKGK